MVLTGFYMVSIKLYSSYISVFSFVNPLYAFCISRVGNREMIVGFIAREE